MPQTSVSGLVVGGTGDDRLSDGERGRVDQTKRGGESCGDDCGSKEAVGTVRSEGSEEGVHHIELSLDLLTLIGDGENGGRGDETSSELGDRFHVLDGRDAGSWKDEEGFARSLGLEELGGDSNELGGRRDSRGGGEGDDCSCDVLQYFGNGDCSRGREVDEAGRRDGCMELFDELRVGSDNSLGTSIEQVCRGFVGERWFGEDQVGDVLRKRRNEVLRDKNGSDTSNSGEESAVFDARCVK